MGHYMEKEKKWVEDPQDAAQHYDQMIWIVFASGLGLSLWILNLFISEHKTNIIVLAFGFIILIYSVVQIISFQQKKNIFHRRLRGNEDLRRIYGNSYLKTKWLSEIILLLVVLTYTVFLGENFRENFNEPNYIFLGISIFGIGIVLIAVALAYIDYRILRLTEKEARK